ncbi:hypothetical protein AJ80_05135 [Polytolypa hystricis UAMH7299]|uniref:Uncharacterized protein n=1 Tax=Polytolypa hystricis (strain UAMH7299) TaxID=1447883 RepID=A0A2B7Y6G4_POLH7|nr:hypothetical protein AJ80_05135 [Polytolypa hystricis UAMH7299]
MAGLSIIITTKSGITTTSKGRQFFKDPRIGKFSITFTQRGGDEGEGLTSPVLHVKNIDNWKEWGITGMCYAKKHADDCKPTPLRCHEGPGSAIGLRGTIPQFSLIALGGGDAEFPRLGPSSQVT